MDRVLLLYPMEYCYYRGKICGLRCAQLILVSLLFPIQYRNYYYEDSRVLNRKKLIAKVVKGMPKIFG